MPSESNSEFKNRSAAIYRGMTRAELNEAYDNRAAVKESAAIIESWSKDSAPIRRQPGARLDIAYGSAPRNKLDYFPCGAPQPPLFIFIHGGYWLRNSKDMFAFAAQGPLAAGFDVAMIGYTLAPEASLTRMSEETERALGWLNDQAELFGFRRDRIIVGGWSAGAHLAAMLTDHPATRAVLAISGLFDLEPVALLDINETLRITPEEVLRLSPALRQTARHPPLCLAWGGRELPELRRQSELYAAAAEAAGHCPDTLRLENHHHFSILDELRGADGRLTVKLRQMIAS